MLVKTDFDCTLYPLTHKTADGEAKPWTLVVIGKKGETFGHEILDAIEREFGPIQGDVIGAEAYRASSQDAAAAE